MPDQLQSIVQRMMDAGESEENIASVIKAYKPAAPAPIGNDRSRVDTNAVGVDQNWIADKASRLPESLRYPAAFAGSLAGTVLEGLTSPEAIATMGASKVVPKPYTGQTGMLRGFGETVESLPGAGVKTKTVGRLMQKIGPTNPNDAPLYKQMESLPTEGGGPLPSGRVATPPYRPETSAPLSDIEQARLDEAAGRIPAGTTKNLENADAIRAQKNKPPPSRPPIQVQGPEAEALAQEPRWTTEDWHSGAEPGSAEAKSAERLHRYDAQTNARYRYLLDSPNGQIDPALLAKLGLGGASAEALRALIMAKLGHGSQESR